MWAKHWILKAGLKGISQGIPKIQTKQNSGLKSMISVGKKQEVIFWPIYLNYWKSEGYGPNTIKPKNSKQVLGDFINLKIVRVLFGFRLGNQPRVFFH